MNKSINISDQFTEEGIQKLKKDMLLRFDQEGSITELKITKVNKKSGKVYAKETKTFTPQEIEAMEELRGNVKEMDIKNEEE